MNAGDRRRVALFAGAISTTFAAFAWLRFATFHNRTFDLAFYSRMAWGTSRGDAWMPLLDAHVFGLHLSPVLVPIGWLGHLFGTAQALIAAQALSAFGAAWFLARLGRRHMGPAGLWLGVAMLLLHPNLGHVLSYEAHPGTLAIAPLAWALERLDARDSRGTLMACLGVLACREDLALLTLIIAALLALRGQRKPALVLAGISLAWLGLFLAVLHPMFAPSGGSFDQHLGHWGGSPGAVISTWLSEPGALLSHVFSGERGTYLLRVLGPLAFLPLFAPRLALVAVPVLALNLVSTFHTTPNLDSHYLTPAVPCLVAAALVAAGRLPKRKVVVSVVALCLAVSYALAGFVGGPEFSEDKRSAAAAAVLARVPDGASVSAPDELLAHLAERSRVHRAPPPDRGDEFTIINASHRQRYARRGTLLRTVEEPVVRDWLARENVGLIAAEAPYLLFARGADPRNSEHIVGRSPDTRDGIDLCQCLRWVDAVEQDNGITLEFVAAGPCPNDLALRFGDGRVDLLFEGELSPAHLRDGDVVRSLHADVSLERLEIGLIRSSGAPPLAGDPREVPIDALRQSTRVTPSVVPSTP